MKLPISIAAIIAQKFTAIKSSPKTPPVSIDIVLKNAPPPPKVESIPSPRTGLIWIPGIWNYVGGWYVWQAGGWELDREGQQYVSARWIQHAHGWQLHPGRWQNLSTKSTFANTDTETDVKIIYDPLAAYR
ncbi:hypothetical protein [Glaciimonas sp. PCH181]|uniref:hypothetical protein n=1 Tax=Glaciimonas sp. PCH181 TaxID=2133943 RepID=UPI000D33841C|nr:hypothetical protein [Glaciimonas sp. PCH181]PUA19724.1 hypothetical protein C7W93_07815 [Glaciimonas sp. PCH181]